MKLCSVQACEDPDFEENEVRIRIRTYLFPEEGGVEFLAIQAHLHPSRIIVNPDVSRVREIRILPFR
jgi:hypothetical protein